MKATNFFRLASVAIVSSSLILASCTKEEDVLLQSGTIETESGNQLKSVVTSSGSNSVSLIAGQTINAGSVLYTDIDTNADGIDDALEITYSLTGGWEFVEIQYWMDLNLSTLPVTKSGNPQVGLFPYKFADVLGQTTYSFQVPFSAINFTCDAEGIYYIASHASVRLLKADGTYQNETAWGQGQRLVQKGNWAMYYYIDIDCDPIIDSEPINTETAFAYNANFSQAFTNFGIKSRWGWTNGPLAPGSYTFTLYAGAAKSDITKGTNVGTLTLVYNGSSAVATYNMKNPYKLQEAQLFLGADVLPVDNGSYTVAPGQYPYNAGELNSVTSYTFNVTGLNGSIYLVAHATVSGF